MLDKKQQVVTNISMNQQNKVLCKFSAGTHLSKGIGPGTPTPLSRKTNNNKTLRCYSMHSVLFTLLVLGVFVFVSERTGPEGDFSSLTLLSHLPSAGIRLTPSFCGAEHQLRPPPCQARTPGLGPHSSAPIPHPQKTEYSLGGGGMKLTIRLESVTMACIHKDYWGPPVYNPSTGGTESEVQSQPLPPDKTMSHKLHVLSTPKCSTIRFRVSATLSCARRASGLPVF